MAKPNSIGSKKMTFGVKKIKVQKKKRNKHESVKKYNRQGR